MDEPDRLAVSFEQNRSHLRAVAYRMLGSEAEADDAVQESWLRFSRAGTDGVDNIGGWLTTIVSRVCLDQLRSRTARREDLRPELPEASGPGWRTGVDPVDDILLADTMGPALLLVLETLAPAERLAFVLHDVFALPFDQIAPILGRTAAATRQLASRGRRRVQGRTDELEVDQARQRQVVEAFLAASRAGDFEALVAVLDPDVTLRADAVLLPPGVSAQARGAEVVAGRARTFQAAQAGQPESNQARLALVDGAVALVTAGPDRDELAVAFIPTVEDGRIVDIEIVAEPDRLARLEVRPIS
jgi:RNA polymerase sigma factor (sigma-70 family)